MQRTSITICCFALLIISSVACGGENAPCLDDRGCDDRNDCTQDFCDTFAAFPLCKHSNLPDGTLCEVNDVSGMCRSGDCRTQNGAGGSGGTGAAGGSGGNGTSPVKRIFITRDNFDGDLRTNGLGSTGLEGGDNICNTAAEDAQLGGTWVAWLSDSTTDAFDRVPDVGPWYLVDETTKIFDDKVSIGDSPLDPIERDELGVANPGQVWTGTNNAGINTTLNCSDWTTNQGSFTDSAFRGTMGFSGLAWTSAKLEPCNMTARLYCFEQ